LIDAPSRLAFITASTMSTACVVTRDAINSDARSASLCATSALFCAALVCADGRSVCAESDCADAEFCTRSGCITCAPEVGASGVTSAVALGLASRANHCITGDLVSTDVAMGRARRPGLSPSATSIMVLTATAVSMIAGKTDAVALLYPMLVEQHRGLLVIGHNSSACPHQRWVHRRRSR
jgi:hypothetical protein